MTSGGGDGRTCASFVLTVARFGCGSRSTRVGYSSGCMLGVGQHDRLAVARRYRPVVPQPVVDGVGVGYELERAGSATR